MWGHKHECLSLDSLTRITDCLRVAAVDKQILQNQQVRLKTV